MFFDDFNLRLDHQFNENFKIYGSWTENRQNGLQAAERTSSTKRRRFDAADGIDALLRS